MPNITFRIDDDLKKKLQAEADRRGLSLSDVIREKLAAATRAF